MKIRDIRNFVITVGMAMILMTSGCAINHPQTADAFRQAVPGAFMAKKESFVVKRPFKQVARTFNKKAPQCLDKRIKTVSQTNMSYQVIVTKYNPTVIIGENKAELYLQQLHEQGVLNISEVPEKGYFLMVVDAVKVNNQETRIDYYGPSKGYGTIVKAIKGWASGSVSGCPDLTKT